MQFIKRWWDEGLPSYGHFCAQVQSINMEKDRKFKNFHFLNICEEDELPCTL